MSENLQTSNNVYYIPMEVTDSTIKGFHLDRNKVEWKKIGTRLVRVVSVPASKEVYEDYMRSVWKEEKYQQRHGMMTSLDEIQSNYEIETADESSSVEDIIDRKEILRILQSFLETLEEIDRTIMNMYLDHKSEREIAPVVGMSQRGVGKRKKRLLDRLKILLKDFQEI